MEQIQKEIREAYLPCTAKGRSEPNALKDIDRQRAVFPPSAHNRLRLPRGASWGKFGGWPVRRKAQLPRCGRATSIEGGHVAKVFTGERPFADPERAARRLLEHAGAFEPTRDGWIDIEQLNHPFLFGDKASLAEFRAGMEYTFSKGWLELHESGLLVRLI